MTKTQRAVAMFFALVLIIVAMSFGSSGEQGSQALAAFLAAIGLILLALMGNKRAESGKGREMELLSVTPNGIAHILQDMGYKGKVSGEGNNWRVESSADGINFFVFLYEPTGPDVPASSLQIRASWSIEVDTKDSLVPVCSAFNENWRYAKASVNDGAVALEWDIYVEGGASSEQLNFGLSTFITLMGTFIGEVRQALPS